MADVEIRGLEAAKAKLAKLSSLVNGVGMQQMMTDIGEVIRFDIEESFERESSPFGEVWKPLSFNTVKARYGSKIHKKNGDHTKLFLKKWGAKGKEKILTDSGHLRSSFTINATPNSVTVGTNVEYAAIHQFGGMAGRGKKVFINARPFLPVDKNNNIESHLERKIVRIIESQILSI